MKYSCTGRSDQEAKVKAGMGLHPNCVQCVSLTLGRLWETGPSVSATGETWQTTVEKKGMKAFPTHIGRHWIGHEFGHAVDLPDIIPPSPWPGNADVMEKVSDPTAQGRRSAQIAWPNNESEDFGDILNGTTKGDTAFNYEKSIGWLKLHVYPVRK